MDRPLRDLPLDALRRRTSLKWSAVEGDVIPSFVAEMDARPIPAVVEAVERAMRDGDTGYPLPGRYAEGFAAFADTAWGWELPVARTLDCADVMTGVTELVRLLGGPRASVVVNPPVYPPFFGFPAHAGARVVDAALGADGRLDLPLLEEVFAREAAAGGPVIYLLCNPHNPTSVVHTRAELTEVARLAREHGVRVVADEIHGPVPPAGFVPYLTVDGSDDAFVVTSASKAFNLAAFKAGLIVAGAAAGDDLARLPELLTHGTSQLGVVAHLAALRGGREWLAALQSDLAENRVLLGDLLARHLPDVRWEPRDGTYLAWLDCRALGLDDPAAFFADRSGVALGRGGDFGSGGAGHVRVVTATTPEVLTLIVERMAAAVG